LHWAQTRASRKAKVVHCLHRIEKFDIREQLALAKRSRRDFLEPIGNEKDFREQMATLERSLLDELHSRRNNNQMHYRSLKGSLADGLQAGCLKVDGLKCAARRNAEFVDFA
jgi:hypothetical protein